MRQVLVTGAAGFIGSHLVEALLARGERVFALADSSLGPPVHLQAVRDHFDFHQVEGNAADRELVRKLLADVDQVYHLAPLEEKTLFDSPLSALDRRLLPFRSLLDEILAASQRRAIKLFLASSSDVYGRNPKTPWQEEDDSVLGPPHQLRWSSGLFEAASELLALACHRQLPLVIGRLFNVAGPRQPLIERLFNVAGPRQPMIGQPLDAAGLRQTFQSEKVLPRFVSQALHRQPLTVYDDGGQVRCFAHVEDICRGMIELMETPAASGLIVNLGSAERITIFELAEKVIALVDPRLDIEFHSYRQIHGENFNEDIRYRVPDLERLHRLTRFQPRYNLDATLREVVEWMRGVL